MSSHRCTYTVTQAHSHTQTHFTHTQTHKYTYTFTQTHTNTHMLPQTCSYTFIRTLPQYTKTHKFCLFSNRRYFSRVSWIQIMLYPRMFKNLPQNSLISLHSLPALQRPHDAPSWSRQHCPTRDSSSQEPELTVTCKKM